MRINIVVEDVADGEFAERDDNAVLVDLAGNLVLHRLQHFAARAFVGISLAFAAAVEADDLAQKIALEPHIGRGAPHLGDGAVDIGGGADGIGEAVADVDLWIEIGRAAFPQAQTDENVRRRADIRLAARGETIRPVVKRAKARIGLHDIGRLRMDAILFGRVVVFALPAVSAIAAI